MKVFIIGAGGQGRVVYEILSYDRNIEVVAFVDNVSRRADETIMGVPVIGNHQVISDFKKNGITGAIIAVGDNHLRKTYYEQMKAMHFELVKAIHRTVHIAHNANIGDGTVVCIGAIIATGANIGRNTIINTGAVVEHGDIVGDHVHISSGVVLAGAVKVGEATFIGAGSIVKDGVSVGRNVTIGAGSVVLEDLPDNVVAVGAPARVIKTKEGTNLHDQKNSSDNGDNRSGRCLSGKVSA